MGSAVLKMVQKPATVGHVLGIMVSSAGEELNFISSSFGVVAGGFHYFHGNVFVAGCIGYHPDGREMTPPEFAEHGVASIFECFSDSHWMVATYRSSSVINGVVPRCV